MPDTNSRHNQEVHENLKAWESKPLLQKVYGDLHLLICENLSQGIGGGTMEIGSGIGSIKKVIPDCICTDMFENPWVDGVENVYGLSFGDGELSNVIMFDVFHHLRHPGDALREVYRVLKSKGRLIIVEPYISVLGRVVYGMFHDEPVSMKQEICWDGSDGFDAATDGYYAAQGNAMRVFCSGEYDEQLAGWDRVAVKKLAGISYAASGGFSKRQLYPTFMYPFMKGVDFCCDFMPWLFATRLMVVLEKR